MLDLRPGLLALYRRVVSAPSSSNQAEHLLGWDTGIPDDIREQLATYAVTDATGAAERTTKWLFTSIGHLAPRGFRLVGVVDGPQIITDPHSSPVLPSAEVMSDFALQVLRDRLAGAASSRVIITATDTVLGGDLRLNVKVKSLDADPRDALPGAVLAAADLVTLITPEGRSKVLRTANRSV